MFKRVLRNSQRKGWSDKPSGEAGIEKLGHRNYVGGKWEEIGRLQFTFMVDRGLKPFHTFLDLGCGCFRGGVHFIRYLDRAKYLGIEKEEGLIKAGIEQELGRSLYEEKLPELVVSGTFGFENFSKVPSFALAQSLFTHLNPRDIASCLERLRRHVADGCHFYATFFEVRADIVNSAKSHPHERFAYSSDQMCEFGDAHGWGARYIGDWGHPRRQMMIEYVAR